MADERRRAAWIGGSILVKGDVVSSEDLVIDGKVEGTIELGDHNLTIGYRGRGGGRPRREEHHDQRRASKATWSGRARSS